MANTRITYRGWGNDRHEATVVAGELLPAQIRRLELTRGQITDLVDELGLARLSHNGNGIVIENMVPTLEPATNARADAATFYDRVMSAFIAGQARALAARGPRMAEAEQRINDKLRGKGADDILSTKKGMLAIQSDQDHVAGWLRSMLSDAIVGAALMSPIGYELPGDAAMRAIDPERNIGNIHCITLFPVAWTTAMGNHEAGANLANVMTPGALVTVGQAQAALDAARLFISTVDTGLARMR